MGKGDDRIIRKFSATKARQFLAIALTVVSIIILAVLSKHPELFGAVSKKTVLTILLVIILLFINFSSFNWRCPSCRQYLGTDILQEKCRKCGVRLRQ